MPEIRATREETIATIAHLLKENGHTDEGYRGGINGLAADVLDGRVTIQQYQWQQHGTPTPPEHGRRRSMIVPGLTPAIQG